MNPQLFLVQMHGEPGSGKSTLALAIGRELPAVVLDKDIISTALMRAALAKGTTGPGSYETIWALTRSILGQGYSVVVDSPAGWPIIEQRGRGIANATHSRYALVECRCADRGEIERRLATRDALESQPREVIDWNGRPGAAEPTGTRLVVDGQRPVALLAAEAIDYIRSRAPAATGARS